MSVSLKEYCLSCVPIVNIYQYIRNRREICAIQTKGLVDLKIYEKAKNTLTPEEQRQWNTISENCSEKRINNNVSIASGILFSGAVGITAIALGALGVGCVMLSSVAVTVVFLKFSNRICMNLFIEDLRQALSQKIQLIKKSEFDESTFKPDLSKTARCIQFIFGTPTVQIPS